MSTGRPHHFGHLLQVSKESLQPLTSYTSLHDLINVYSHRSGADKTTPGDKILMSTEASCQFDHLLQVLKKTLLSLILYNFFMILFMYIAMGQWLTISRGQSFDVNRNILSLHSFVASFKNIFLKSDFIHFFNDLIHVYRAPG